MYSFKRFKASSRDREFFINLLKVLIVSSLIIGSITFIDWIVSSNMLTGYGEFVTLLHLILPISIILTQIFNLENITNKRICIVYYTIIAMATFFVPFLLSYMHPFTFRFLELSPELIRQLRASNQPLNPLIFNFTFCGVAFLLFVLSLKLIQKKEKGFVCKVVNKMIQIFNHKLISGNPIKTTKRKEGVP